MLKVFYIRQPSRMHISGVKCDWCGQYMREGSMAVKDRYGIFCDKKCFDQEINAEMKEVKHPDKKFIIKNG